MLKRNSSILGVLFLAMIIAGCASSEVVVNEIPSKNVDSYMLIKEKEYQRGYKQAIKDNKDKWIQEGFEEAKRALLAYKKDLKSYEAGKYAIKEKLVTYPKIISFRDSEGNVVVKSLGCEIKPYLDSNTLLEFYRKFEKKYNNQKMNNIKIKEKNEDLSSLGVAVLNYNKSDSISTFNRVEEDKNIIHKFKKTYKIKKIIEEYGLSCATTDKEFICNFQNKEEFNEFCKVTKVCENDK